jgi:hypothetical protein
MMNSRLALPSGLVLLAVLAASCGDKIEVGSTSPVGPSTLAPLFAPRLEGIWGGLVTLDRVVEGGNGSSRAAGDIECVGQAFNAVVGETIDTTLTITQTTGTDVTARLVSSGSLDFPGTGLACAYTGRVTNRTLVLDATQCTEKQLNFQCPPAADGTVRVRIMDLVGSSITATLDAPVNVTSVSGVVAYNYNISDGDGTPRSAMVTNHRFDSLTRR